jgi:hypothetical protein
MDEKYHVFILGAGASNDFGYPVGRELRKRIIRNLNSQKHKELLSAGIDQRIIDDFCNAFSQAGKPSIDSFLEKNTDFTEVGKLAIAQVLMPCEGGYKHTLHDPDKWYSYLLNMIDADKELFPRRKLAFITFNYDRSLEQALFVMLSNGNPYSDDEVVEMISRIPIVHVYGQLDQLPWQSEESRDYGFMDQSDITILKEAAAGIHLIHEGAMESFDKAKDLLAQAKIISFLGFAYHEENLDRLDIKNYSKAEGGSASIRGTISGMQEIGIAMVRKYFGDMSCPNKVLQEYNCEVMEYFQQHAQFLI